MVSYFFWSVVQNLRAPHFFFGLFGEDADEIVYDQISFSVRKGKYLKEKKELIRDRRELLGEVKEYVKTEQEIRQLISCRHSSNPAMSGGNSAIKRLEERRSSQSELADYVDREIDKINERSDWSQERKEREIRRLNELLAEIALED